MAKKEPDKLQIPDSKAIQRAANQGKPPTEQKRNESGQVEPTQKKEPRKVTSYTLKPDLIKSVKRRANELSTEDKRISASQVLESILTEYFGK